MIEARPSRDGNAVPSRERRHFPRLQIAVQIELRAKGDPVPIRSNTADISVGGCYMEMAVTLDPGTAVDIILWLDNEKLPLEGRVVTRHPHFGNGIEFIDLTPESEARLRTFLKNAEGSKLT